MKHAKSPRLGSGLTEYSIVVALVAIALVLAVLFFGTEIIHQYGGRATPEVERLEP